MFQFYNPSRNISVEQADMMGASVIKIAGKEQDAFAACSD